MKTKQKRAMPRPDRAALRLQELAKIAADLENVRKPARRIKPKPSLDDYDRQR